MIMTHSINTLLSVDFELSLFQCNYAMNLIINECVIFVYYSKMFTFHMNFNHSANNKHVYHDWHPKMDIKFYFGHF